MAETLFPNGSTITFAGGFSAKIQQIGTFARSVAVADITPLEQGDATYKKMKFSRRYGHEAMTVNFFFNEDSALPALGTTQRLTITYPNGDRQLTGLGAIIGDNTGEMISDEVVVASLDFMFEGGDVAANVPIVKNVEGEQMAITLQEIAPDADNIFLDTKLVGQYYRETNRICLVQSVSKAEEAQIETACNSPDVKTTAPPPDIPEEFE